MKLKVLFDGGKIIEKKTTELWGEFENLLGDEQVTEEISKFNFKVMEVLESFKK